MGRQRFRLPVSVFVIVFSRNRVLMLHRSNTGWMDGLWSIPAGGVDGKELSDQAAIRELFEETNLTVCISDLKLRHVQHNVTHGEEWIGMYFMASAWRGEAIVKEPHKHSSVGWFPCDELPSATVPYVRQALECIADDLFYSTYVD